MKALGIDPDLHHAGVALVERRDDGSPELLAVRVVKVPSRVAGERAVLELALAYEMALADLLQGHRVDRVCVESQELSMRRIEEENIAPQGIINLAQSAGVALAVASRHCPRARLYLPRPTGSRARPGWKPSIKKHRHQKRVLSRLGIPYVPKRVPTTLAKVPVVDGAHGVTKSHWNHVIDAAGLALWALEN